MAGLSVGVVILFLVTLLQGSGPETREYTPVLAQLTQCVESSSNTVSPRADAPASKKPRGCHRLPITLPSWAPNHHTVLSVSPVDCPTHHSFDRAVKPRKY